MSLTAVSSVAERSKAWMASSDKALLRAARDDEGLIPEPQAVVPLEHVTRHFEVAAISEHAFQPRVLYLAHVDRGIPGSKQRRCADRHRYLAGQRVHVVTEQRSRIGIGVEVQLPRIVPEVRLHFLQKLVTIVDEGVLAGPDALKDLVAGIVAVRMDGEQPASRPEAAGERRQHLVGLELQG